MNGIFRRGTIVAMFLAVAGMLAACGDSANEARNAPSTFPTTTTYFAVLVGAQENPPVLSAADGYAAFVVNTGSGQIDGTVNTFGLAGNAAHIHSAEPGINGSIIIPLTPSPAGGGVWMVPPNSILSGEQFAALNSGGLYVNVHSNLYPGGQIRGQIGRTVLTAKLTGSQENPPTPSAATGTGVFSVDPVTRALSARVVTSGITATAAHIHAGAIGVNAPVLIPTTQSAAASPVWNFAPATLSEAQYRALLFGNMYVNTHSATYPGGEARAQIGNIVRTGLLSGANEVPSNTSTGSGRARADLNSGTLDISITVTTTGVPGAAAHLHIAATGVNGPIIVPLTEGPTGTWTSAAGAKLTQAQAVAFAAGGTYFNVHSAALPGGEIRAQASGLD